MHSLDDDTGEGQVKDCEGYGTGQWQCLECQGRVGPCWLSCYLSAGNDRSEEKGISHAEPGVSKSMRCGAGHLPPGGPQLEHWVPRVPCQGLMPDHELKAGYKGPYMKPNDLTFIL